MKALVINGPNLNMLGIREPGIYGSDNYDRLVQICKEAGAAQSFDEVEVFQSNHEGSIVDKIQEAYGKIDGIDKLAEQRMPRYRAWADYIIDSRDSAANTAQALLDTL